MSGQFVGDKPPSAAASMERIYGFLVSTDRGNALMQEWKNAREGLNVLVDYKQVVSRLASAACDLCGPLNDDLKRKSRAEVIDCVAKLQQIRSDL